MALSLVVLLVPVLLIVLVYRALYAGDQPVVIDPAPTVAQAQAAASFPVSVPHGLSEGWRPVSAVYAPAGEGSTLRIGYLTPSGAGVQVLQSSVPVDKLLTTELGTGQPAGDNESINGRSWQSFAGSHGQTALVLAEPGHTTIVIGPATLPELRTLAASMR
jgi:hypothetical protein